MSFSRAKSRLRRPPDKRPALLCYRLAPLVLFVSSILFLSRHLALNPKEPSSSEPFLEVDATTESCYKSVRSLTSSPSGQDHTFDPSPTFPRSKHVKRDQALLRRFGCLVNEGERFLEEGLVHATGRFSNSPQDFGNHPFRDNGWSEDTANDPNPWEWDEVLDSISGGMPPMEQIFHVRLSQDQLFNNAYHRNLPVS